MPEIRELRGFTRAMGIEFDTLAEVAQGDVEELDEFLDGLKLYVERLRIAHARATARTVQLGLFDEAWARVYWDDPEQRNAWADEFRAELAELRKGDWGSGPPLVVESGEEGKKTPTTEV